MYTHKQSHESILTLALFLTLLNTPSADIDVLWPCLVLIEISLTEKPNNLDYSNNEDYETFKHIPSFKGLHTEFIQLLTFIIYTDTYVYIYQ